MKAVKLKSGSWNCRVYWYTDDKGKKIYKSFTCQDPSPRGKKICEAEASAWALERKEDAKVKLKHETTFADALEKYIADREEHLSPSSIRKYRAMQRNHFAEINDMVLVSITEDDVQRMVNRMVKQKYSARMIGEVTSLTSTVLKQNRIMLFTNLITKPKKKKKRKQYIPTDGDIKMLLAHTEGTEMYIPIMVAAFCGLRRGEVSALLVEDIHNGIVHVHRNMVDTPQRTWIVKEPKTEEGDRETPIPSSVVEELPESGPITKLRPNIISSRFTHIVRQCGLPPELTFHCLRHYVTSKKIQLGENDLVVRKEMGWSEKDYQEMKQNYGHLVKGHEYSVTTCEYFDDMKRSMKRH